MDRTAIRRIATICYTIVASELGSILVAATERGVCNVRFGDDAEALAAALGREFPFAELAQDDARLAPAVDALLAYLDGRAPVFDVELDVRASQFQRRVWAAIRSIPYGRTQTYGALAAAIGRPRAARAVARACASNPVALAIPCHRVVPADGGAGGYRWGEARKRALLEREQSRADAADAPAA